MFNSKIALSKDYLFLNLDASNNLDALRKMAFNLNLKGVVKKSFIPAILEREKVFSTGLEFAEAGIAIPHTDTIFVNTPAISVATLKKPLSFQEMGSMDKTINVKLIIMLAIKDSHGQIDFLQNLIEKFQTKGVLSNLINSTSEDTLLVEMKKILEI